MKVRDPARSTASRAPEPAQTNYCDQVPVAKDVNASVRLALATVVGVAAGAVSVALAPSHFAPLVGWVVAGCVFLAWTWLVVLPMDGPETRRHATTEDPPQTWAHVCVIGAVVASIGGVAYLLVGANGSGLPEALLGIVAILTSWVLVHTLFTLRYAHLYYTADSQGVDFPGDDPPGYVDFAYLAFTLGMTYQVSDTNLSSRAVRAAALRHALLSYLLGAVIVAMTINVVVQLASGPGGSG